MHIDRTAHPRPRSSSPTSRTLARAALASLALSLTLNSTTPGQINLASRGVLYATTGLADGGRLITLDVGTGAGTLVGATGLGAVPDVAANSKCELFCFSRPSSNTSLYRLDAQTGTSHFVANIGGGLSGIESMVFDGNDVLYAASQFPASLLRINTTTGAPSTVGPTGPDLVGLAFDPTSGVLYASQGRGVDAIYTIDLATTPGKTTLVGNTGLGGSTPSIAFDAAGNLYGVKGGGQGENLLISIDKSTGAGTVIGPIGFPAVSGLTFCLPPNPSVAVEGLIGDVQSLDLDEETRRSLIAKLSAAFARIAEGDPESACFLLDAFISQVGALQGTKIPAVTAGILIIDAGAICAGLGGQVNLHEYLVLASLLFDQVADLWPLSSPIARSIYERLLEKARQVSLEIAEMIRQANENNGQFSDAGALRALQELILAIQAESPPNGVAIDAEDAAPIILLAQAMIDGLLSLR